MPTAQPNKPAPNSTLLASDISVDGGGNSFFIADGSIVPATNITSGAATVKVATHVFPAPAIAPNTANYSFQMPYNAAMMNNKVLTLSFSFTLSTGVTVPLTYQVNGVVA